MCGIVGVRSDDGAVAKAQRMLARIAHRGPDGVATQLLDNGRWALGHARLAIIDISPSGAQPMRLHGTELWITYNGEIYNYRALRCELEGAGRIFRTHSDTEVLLAGYAEWGERLLERLDGIFAFGLWDGARRRLWLARDHLGVKPLYHTRDARAFAFASEPKALLAAMSRAATPDRASLHDYLSFGYVPGERTAFAEIAKLPPGHMLWWENDAYRVERYWDAGSAALNGTVDEGSIIAEATRRLDAACESQLESDVPVGLLVSGGIDSSAVSSSVVRCAPSSEGFTIGFDEPKYDERRYARILAQGCGIRLHERVVDGEATPPLLDRLAMCHDEPFADSSSIPCLSLFELVRQNGYKVVLGGDGGDELFSGYTRYDALERMEGRSQARWPLKVAGARGLRQVARFALKPGRTKRPAWRSYDESIRRFSFAEQSALLEPAWRPASEDALWWTFDAYWDAERDTVQAAQLYDVRTYLPEDILVKVDRTAMHWGVEARVPLLARRLVEFALAVPTHVQRRGGERKHVLKGVLAGRVAPELISSRKKGFGLPLERTVGPLLREWIARARRPALVQDGVLAKDALPSLLGDLDKLWSLFTLENWWAHWVRGAR